MTPARRAPRCVLIILLLILSSAPLASSATKKKSDPKKQKKKPVDTTRYADVCTSLSKTRYPPLKPNDRRRHSALRSVMEASGLANMLLLDSPRLKAACWMMYDDPSRLGGKHRRFLPRYALAVLYYTTQGPKWKKAEGWMTDRSECKWRGVQCSRPGWFYIFKHVTKIDLGFNALNGLIPREMSLLREVRELDLNGNDIQGVLPHRMMSEMKKLEVLKLHMNNILGKIPTEVGLLKNLRELHLYGNYLQGELPKEIGNLARLEVLDVSYTYMDDVIPTQLGNAKKLKVVNLDNCNFVGRVPSSLCKLKNLRVLSADCLGQRPEVTCECCTVCCQGLPDPKCVEMKPKGDDKGKAKATTKKKKK